MYTTFTNCNYISYLARQCLNFSLDFAYLYGDSPSDGDGFCVLSDTYIPSVESHFANNLTNTEGLGSGGKYLTDKSCLATGEFRAGRDTACG